MAAHHSGSGLQLACMPQLAEAKNSEDDWTGLTDAAARRKRQNRLNVRAFRRRKALQSQEQPCKSLARALETPIICWIEDQQSVSVISTPHTNPKTPIIPYLSTSPNQWFPTSAQRIIFPLSPDHLITLVQFNVLRATLTNLRLLSLLHFIPHECSLALNITPSHPTSSLPLAIPPSLQPTALQLETPHAPWIDIIPDAKWRDNLIMAEGKFDEDDMCCDMVGGLWEGYPDGNAACWEKGVVAWETPWDVKGWEVSKGFWSKWGGLMLRGCVEVLDATNEWRRRRGDEELVWEEMELVQST